MELMQGFLLTIALIGILPMLITGKLYRCYQREITDDAKFESVSINFFFVGIKIAVLCACVGTEMCFIYHLILLHLEQNMMRDIVPHIYMVNSFKTSRGQEFT